MIKADVDDLEERTLQPVLKSGRSSGIKFGDLNWCNLKELKVSYFLTWLDQT